MKTKRMRGKSRSENPLIPNCAEPVALAHNSRRCEGTYFPPDVVLCMLRVCSIAAWSVAHDRVARRMFLVGLTGFPIWAISRMRNDG